MKKRIRAGFGSKGGLETRLKPLSPSYIKQRQKKNLASTTSPSTSNLTSTGQMVKSIRATVQGQEVIIGPSGVKNIAKAEYTQEARPFLELTSREQKIISDSINRDLNREIRRIFK